MKHTSSVKKRLWDRSYGICLDGKPFGSETEEKPAKLCPFKMRFSKWICLQMSQMHRRVWQSTFCWTGYFSCSREVNNCFLNLSSVCHYSLIGGFPARKKQIFYWSPPHFMFLYPLASFGKDATRWLLGWVEGRQRAVITKWAWIHILKWVHRIFCFQGELSY